MNVDIGDAPVELSVVLGHAKKSVKDILQMGEGSIMELEQNANEPATIYVNNMKFGLGEVVVIDENYGIRITKIFTPEERKEVNLQ